MDPPPLPLPSPATTRALWVPQLSRAAAFVYRQLGVELTWLSVRHTARSARTARTAPSATRGARSELAEMRERVARSFIHHVIHVGSTVDLASLVG